MRTEDSNSEPQAHGAAFATTHRSVALAAGQQELPQAAEALEKPCRTYWYPLYVYVRRRGYSREDAQDLVCRSRVMAAVRDACSSVDTSSTPSQSGVCGRCRGAETSACNRRSILVKSLCADGRFKFRSPGARGRICGDALERGAGGG